nr:MAG: putative methyltransferase [Eriocheir sinensis noda-like virus]
MLQFYYATLAILAGFTAVEQTLPVTTPTWYEALGLPGYRTLVQYQTAMDVLDYTGILNLAGIPNESRYGNIAEECQSSNDFYSSWNLLHKHGLAPPITKHTTLLCRRMEARGLVHDGVPSVVAQALTLPARLIAALPLTVLFMSGIGFLATALIVGSAVLMVRRYRLLNVNTMPSPYTHREVSNLIKKRMEQFDINRDDGSDNQHKKMASVRRFLERACIHVLTSLTGSAGRIRDIGGSLTRNASLGKRLHICFPNLSSADKMKAINTPRPENDVGYHKGEDCKLSHLPSLLTYVDFHLPLGALTKTIRAPTLIITHDFTRVIGEENWFEGEATVKRVGDFISMSTRGGCDYFHGFHSWRQEGVVCNADGAFTYHRVYDDHHSIVLWCVPLSGRFNPLSDNTLASSAGHLTKYQMSNGATAVLDGVNFVIDTPGLAQATVSAETIIRTAFQMSQATRDEKWAANLNSILRGRFTADKQPQTALPQASELAVQLADTFAVSNRMSVIGDPKSYGVIPRFCLRVFLNSTKYMPDFLTGGVTSMVLAVRRLIFGAPVSILTSWAWNSISLPAYEVFWDEVMAKRVEANKPPKQPFRVAGAATPAAPPQQPGGAPLQDGRKPSRRDRKASAGSGAQAPPQPSTTHQAAPSIPVRTRSPSPGDPAHLPATTRANASGVAPGGRAHRGPKKGAGAPSAMARRRDPRRPTGQHPLPTGPGANQGRCSANQPDAANQPLRPNQAVLGPQGEPMATAHRAHGFRPMGVAVQPLTPATAAPGARGSGKGRAHVARRDHERVHQDRDVVQRDGPAQHQPAVRQVSLGLGAIRGADRDTC